jgi:hypothetical protein
VWPRPATGVAAECLAFGGAAPPDGLNATRVPSLRRIGSARWAGWGAGIFAPAATAARRLIRLPRIAVSRPDVGALPLRRPQVVDPAELFGPGRLVPGRVRPAATPPAAARLIRSGAGLFGSR